MSEDFLHARKSRMPRRIPHRRRAVPTTFRDDTAHARSPARSSISLLWLGLWRLMKGLTLVILLAVGSDGVWWQIGLQLRLRAERKN
jgi:hypothetical protein